MNEQIKAIIYIFGMGMCLIGIYYSGEIYKFLVWYTPPEIKQFITWLFTA